MKAYIFASFAAQALAAAINRDGNDNDDVITRSFDLPAFPGSSWPTEWPSRPINKEKKDTIDLGDVVQGQPDPDEVQIVGITYGGTGCPSSTVSSIISDDRTVMTLIFDEYVASIGPESGITDNRKNCQLNINLRYPGGFQYSILSADYRGYAYLEEGVYGTQKSTYYFSGQTEQVLPPPLLPNPLSTLPYLYYPQLTRHNTDLHSNKLDRPLRRRLPNPRRSRKHLHRLVPLRRKRCLEHQLSTTTYERRPGCVGGID